MSYTIADDLDPDGDTGWAHTHFVAARSAFRIASLLAAPDHPGSFVLAHQDQEAETMEKKCMGSVEKVLGG
jgi:hypothetical protein